MDDLIADILVDFFRASEVSTTRAHLVAAVDAVSRQLGIEHFAMAHLPSAHEPLDGFFIGERWPPGWRERYLKSNYFHCDPVVRLVRTSDRPIVWSKSIRMHALGEKSKRVMSEAAEFGLLDGVTIPLHSKLGLDGLFSAGGRREPMRPVEVSLLQIVAESAHRRLRELVSPRRSQPDSPYVTRSERECLTLCADGKTDREIGRMTHRSPRTVQAHLHNLQQKLGVSNRAQLIAEAFRRGLQY
ncbi:helix-turn-helix transcriptional regulator [Rhizobium tumorigenes]|uniref:LuxR family transcriptional regulator n=1 Tax=Rhizobium tumorigenes TaxID=2041385 RepID=A0AAF1KQ81_9HYPH|nr:LuxR family transcriptional regulator [Rhizobium tumorigenes]WFR97815.1 LuxR family transcriptional regulator [Rhizobium tumorigenes]